MWFWLYITHATAGTTYHHMPPYIQAKHFSNLNCKSCIMNIDKQIYAFKQGWRTAAYKGLNNWSLQASWKGHCAIILIFFSGTHTLLLDCHLNMFYHQIHCLKAYRIVIHPTGYVNKHVSLYRPIFQISVIQRLSLKYSL